MHATNPIRFPNHGNNFWSEEEERRLRALAAPERNLTAAEIAAHFLGKFTRNAVLGKLNRLQIHIAKSNGHASVSASFWNQGDNLRRLIGFYNSPLGYSRPEIAAEFGIEMRLLRRGIEKMRAAGEKVKALKPHQNGGRPRTAAARIKARANHSPAVPFAEAPAVSALTIMELKPSSCRWPVEGHGCDMKYCGHVAIPGIPYCGPHARRAYARP